MRARDACMHACGPLPHAMEFDDTAPHQKNMDRYGYGYGVAKPEYSKSPRLEARVRESGGGGYTYEYFAFIHSFGHHESW